MDEMVEGREGFRVYLAVDHLDPENKSTESDGDCGSHRVPRSYRGPGTFEHCDKNRGPKCACCQRIGG